MKKRYLLLALPLLIIALVSTSYGWQGRMDGMGDPYGLLSDEADFLIHPAKIANGEGVRFYGDYRFLYTGVTGWDYGLDLFDPTTGVFVNNFSKETSGDEQQHATLLGGAFPVGPGRGGIFFQYEGMRGDYDGHVGIIGPWPFAESDYNLTGKTDNFLLSFLYGLPVKDTTVGGEIQFGYHQEENKSRIYELGFLNNSAMNYQNDIWYADWDLFPFMIPYDSSYWEALLKGSIEGTVGPIGLEFTVRGGFIFGGDNEWEYGEQNPGGISGFDLDGNVEGWRIGGDLWLRYARAEDLFLPFLIRIDYQEKARDGEGTGFYWWIGDVYNSYKHQEKNLDIEVGGGVDKEFGEGVRVAAGIYYNYLQGTTDLRFMRYGAGGVWSRYDYSDLPGCTEHRIILRLVDEHQFTPAVVLRGGINVFFGWMREEFEAGFESNVGSGPINDISLNGPRWGIGVSVGGTVKLAQFTVEPFLNAGYQEFHLKGDGEGVDITPVPTALYLWDMDLSRSEWSIGGGFSVLFDLP